MIEFAWPLVFLLLALPFVIYLFFPASNCNSSASLKVPAMEDFECFKNQSPLSLPKISLFLSSLIFLFLVVSAARPQIISDAIEIPQSGRDLMLAVDLSGSMQIKDFEINGKWTDRLTALKLIAGDFIDKRKGDRIGLILFGAESYLQAPLTFDTTTVKQLLMETEVGLAGNETAMGDAIGLAIKQLRESQEKSRVLILLTDGNNNSGFLSPEKAAEIAAHEKLKIHTVAIGSKGKANPFFQQTMNNSQIDEKALQAIAEKTGGSYFRAYNTQELVQIYKKIDQLESIEKTNQQYRPMREIYYWPLLAALMCSGLLLFYKSVTR